MVKLFVFIPVALGIALTVATLSYTNLYEVLEARGHFDDLEVRDFVEFKLDIEPRDVYDIEPRDDFDIEVRNEDFEARDAELEAPDELDIYRRAGVSLE